ncbi:hypothetical protein L596_004004 [Steinernema carpocapsae]|uniref:inositol-polyphosphate 5-phosphatase n=1 Tax=Steinernema carpocapsae TaxID=34508 RepID=A0A4U8UUA6_STECR|nr:hypothetical protein L596_004004 [Steinernema carpocapsae]
MKDILLLTANVGSLFDHTGRIHKSWSESIVQTIRREDARFVAVHMQEVGGKNYQECSEQVQPLIEKLYSELSDYTAALAILDLDFDLNDQYTALGSIFLVHNSALSLVEQYNFHVKKYQHLQDPHLNVFREHLSECPFLVKTKFPKHFWPAIKWGRKGYMHTRWRFNNIPLDLINVHLFHDESNLALIHENPSLYSNNRKRALNYVLDQLKTFSNGEKPNAVFIFGDLNFRLDSPSFLNRLTGNGQTDAHHQLEDPHGSVSGNRLTNSRYHLNGSDHASDENSGNADPLRRTVSAIEFRSSGNNESIMTGDAQQNCVLRIEKKLFDYFNHKKLLRDWRGYLEDDKEVHDFPSLKEIEINFPPTYPWSEDPDESEVLMKTRAPAWCDRVLMNDQAHRLVFGANSVLYDSIGKDTCMGDHKPVFLSFSVS